MTSAEPLKPFKVSAPEDDDDGLAYLITTDRILATIGGILGGVVTCLALLIRYAHHSNTAAAKGHQP